MDKISNAIKCMNCKSILKSPVLLPCKHSICKNHVSECSTASILCMRCGVEHAIDKSGDGDGCFLENEALAEIISAQIEALSFGKVHDESNRACAELEALLADIDTIMNDPEHFTYDEIDKLKNVVMIKSEQLKLKIDEETDKLVKKLADYQECCKAYLSQKDYLDKSKNLDDVKSSAKSKLNDAKRSLNEIKFDEEKWTKITQESKAESTELRKQLELFKTDLLLKEFVSTQSHVDFFKRINIDRAFVYFPKTIDNIDNNRLDSYIVNNAKLVDQLFKLCGFNNPDDWTLIYRASQNGFSAQQFHQYCDNQDNGTLVIIKSTQGYIFGGYTQASWNYDYCGDETRVAEILGNYSSDGEIDVRYYDQNGQYKSDPSTFLFSLYNRENRPIKLCGTNPTIYCDRSYGPTFGNGHDIYICDNSNINTSSYSNLGSSFNYPNNQKLLSYRGSTQSAAQYFLAGSYNFTVAEIEVFVKTN